MKRETQPQRSSATDPVILGEPLTPAMIQAAAPSSLLDLVAAEPQSAFPAIAKDPEACATAAARCGRNSIGSEVDPDYFAQCVERLRNATGQAILDLSA